MKSVELENLANRIRETIEMLQQNEIKVLPGMKGSVGELLVVSKLRSLKGVNPHDVEYRGGRSRYDVTIKGRRKEDLKILIKTKFYTDEPKHGIEEGFLWSDVYVEAVPEKNRAKIEFDFIIFVGLRNARTEFYILTEKEFRDHAKPFGWGKKRGGLVIGIVEKKKGNLSNYAKNWANEQILELFRESKNDKGWQKIVKEINPN